MTDRTDEIRKRCDAGRTVRITDVKYLLGEIDRLTEAHEAMLRDLQTRSAQVEALERERDAAVEDLKTMALAMRESDELEVGCCFACKFDASNNDNMGPWNECPGFNTDNCFEWRGPHEAGKERGVMTNADRIRSMTDEELADFIFLSPEMEFEICRYCTNGNPTPTDDRGQCLRDGGRCYANDACDAFKDWLRQPAEEVHDGQA